MVMSRSTRLIPVLLLAAAALCGCSTTRMLSDGEYRLARNVIEFTDKESGLNPKDVQNYIKQQPNSYFIFNWNPFLSVWNWQNGKGRLWDKTMRKLGVAPVVSDPKLIDKSIDNLDNHLK